MDEPVRLHMFRHLLASHLLESSSDLRLVQELLGQANISTAQVHTHVDFQHLAKVYESGYALQRLAELRDSSEERRCMATHRSLLD